MTTRNKGPTQFHGQSLASHDSLAHNVNAVIAIAYRELLKLLRDPVRLLSLLIFPFIYIGFLGSGMQTAFGKDAGYNYLSFVFTGVLAQTLIQTSALEIVSLLEDRENAFSQEIFVSPISRYAIVFGKIIGGTLFAVPQGLAIFVFAVIVLGVPVSLPQTLGVIIVGLITSLYGGAFGMIILGLLPSRRAMEQVFPFVFLPQFFTAGVFTPIDDLPLPLEIISRLSPMRYVVDLMRNVFFWGSPEYDRVVLDSLYLNVMVLAASFLAFMVVGTFPFVRTERNR